jgi:trimeric autotransporter adhesin
VFFSKTDSTELDTGGAANGYSSAAAKNAAAAARNAAAAAQAAAQSATSAATTAAQSAGSASQAAVLNARKWAAPQLESIADYCTTTVAPMLDSALRSTAQRVRPVEPRRRRVPPALTWSLLGAAVLAAIGAVAALVRFKYRAAMATDTEEDTVIAPAATADETMPQAPMEPTTTSSSETSVNGRVSATGW